PSSPQGGTGRRRAGGGRRMATGAASRTWRGRDRMAGVLSLRPSVSRRRAFSPGGAPGPPAGSRIEPLRHPLDPDLPAARSGVAAPGERSGLRLPLVSGFLHDRRHLRVGHEALPALLVPVEDHPDAVVLGG